jgi:hypothetical protein
VEVITYEYFLPQSPNAARAYILGPYINIGRMVLQQFSSNQVPFVLKMDKPQLISKIPFLFEIMLWDHHDKKAEIFQFQVETKLAVKTGASACAGSRYKSISPACQG